MITKHSTTTSYGWKMAIGIGLVGATAVLIAAIVFADRAGTPVAAASLRLPAGIRTFVADLTNALGFGEVVIPMQSPPLGIDLPQGVDLRDLPRGLTDYIRPGSVTPAVQTQSFQLGIDLPHGLTDYLRPQHAEPSVAASSAILDITMPTGAQYTDLPRGVTDYLRANK
jgi:hypothetical protein